ncbi:phosphoribosyl transferase [[Clostridium] sordellii]|uniref:ComF family protein n=1 Tax=Paraclostridium sordellii TaxID=1505 RepID=UPI0005E8DAD6|nr:phosphoribosyl transferase [[Clostridium] sordellii] [Paeniclostridium sordellii]
MFLEVLYPENIKCIICNKAIGKNNSYSLCKECFINLNFISDGCIKCGKSMINQIIEEFTQEQLLYGCPSCLNKSYYFDKAISCIEYDELSKKIVFGFKYNNKTFMSRYIANIINEKIYTEHINYDYILYVPLHKSRERKRGFNQARLISNELSKITNIEVLDIINRSKKTERLFKLKNEERTKELKNAFSTDDRIRICKNKKVLLIDDIFTTGSTVNEISKLLKINGVDKVYVCTFLTRINCY